MDPVTLVGLAVVQLTKVLFDVLLTAVTFGINTASEE